VDVVVGSSFIGGGGGALYWTGAAMIGSTFSSTGTGFSSGCNTPDNRYVNFIGGRIC